MDHDYMQELLGRQFVSKQSIKIAANALAIRMNVKYLQYTATRELQHSIAHMAGNITKTLTPLRRRDAPTAKVDYQEWMYLDYESCCKRWRQMAREIRKLNKHNHPLDKNDDYYAVNRKPDEEMSMQILSMTDSGSKPLQIWKQLKNTDDGIIMNLRDLYNFRQQVFDEDRHGKFSRIFENLVARDYIIRCRVDSSSKSLDAILLLILLPSRKLEDSLK
ncbi:hypothetical protein BDB00DRAFT_869648 [Zychaea mexicana]|uniref:uncharacterized protein n=1 Tax=Zychaea mexicana TaxID=64656 RepID=UPI0022FEE079|nr:uncharacterized protein BDB00DRAFT_869648 [Zychaea mexicana]KAI9496353.1 hypothetical protein BDB00DRAFT_869648 [Zychaea mexicana]